MSSCLLPSGADGLGLQCSPHPQPCAGTALAQAQSTLAHPTPTHQATQEAPTQPVPSVFLWLGHALEPPCCDHELPPAGLGDGIQMGLQVRQLPQRSTFQDPASGRGGVSVPKEKNIRDASSQELSKSRAQTAPSLCSIFVAPGC